MKIAIVPLLVVVLLFGCTIPEKSSSGQSVTLGKTLIDTNSVVGTWRAYSSYIGFVNGGHSVTELPGGEKLQINEGGTWDYGSSHGTWSVESIASSDWEKWKVSQYSPTKKIVLDGWNGGSADGPIEESSNQIDFIWVIYNAAPPVVSEDAQIQIKFGH